MYQLTDKNNIIIDKVLNRAIIQGSPEWNAYLRWLGKGNKPAPIDGKVVVIETTQPEKVDSGFKISKELWNDLDKAKSIKAIKEWLEEALK